MVNNGCLLIGRLQNAYDLVLAGVYSFHISSLENG